MAMGNLARLGLRPQPTGMMATGPEVTGFNWDQFEPAQQHGNTGINGGAAFGNLQDPNAWMQLAGNEANTLAWIKQNYPDLPDDTARYYAGVIKGQPGANPMEQAGSAQYYLNMIKEREYGNSPTYVGSAQLQGGAGGGRNYTVFNAPTYDDYMNSPGTLAGLKFGQDAIQRSAAAKGTLLTGGTLKALQQHAQDWGSTGYNDYADQQFKFHQGNFGNLYSLAGMGRPQ